MIGSALGDAIGEVVLYHAGSGFIPLERRSIVIGKETLLSAVQTFPELKYTDDTHMAIGIAEAIANPGRLELDPIKRRFLINYQASPELPAIARRIAALTHLHPVGQDAAAVLSAALACLLHYSGRELVPKEVLDHMLAAAETAEIPTPWAP